MSKKLQYNTVPKKQTTIVDWREQIFAWRERPVGEAFINNLCQEAEQYYIDNPNAKTLEQWLHAKKLSYELWDTWCKKWPQLQLTDEHIRMGLGVIREEGALTFGLHASTVALVQAHYSRVWKQRERETAQLALEASQLAAKLAESLKEQEETIIRIKTVVSHAMEGVDDGFRQQATSEEVSTETLPTPLLESPLP
jgi:hypothetical protein